MANRRNRRAEHRDVGFLLAAQRWTCIKRNVGELEMRLLSKFHLCATLGARKTLKSRNENFGQNANFERPLAP